MSIKFKLFTHVYTTISLKEIIEHYIKKLLRNYSYIWIICIIIYDTVKLFKSVEYLSVE